MSRKEMEQTDQNSFNLIGMSFLLLAVSQAFLQESTSRSSGNKTQCINQRFCSWTFSTEAVIETCQHVVLFYCVLVECVT